MLVSSRREIKRWNVGDAEILNHETLDEAVEMYLDGYRFGGIKPDTPKKLRECLRDMGDVEVTGYAQQEISPHDLAEAALEYLDESVLRELANPDDGATVWSKETEAAALALGKLMLLDFWIWAMEPVETVTVNALSWVEENAPGWLVDTAGDAA